MKNTNTRKILSLISILIVLASTALMFVDIFTDFTFGFHPALTFLFVLLAGFGIMSLSLGITRKSPAYFFLSSLLLGLALLYVFIIYVKAWWLIIILMFVVWSLMAILSLMRNGNRTEDIALNKDENYKNYQQRKAEKALQEEKEEKIPEIKSFKE